MDDLLSEFLIETAEAIEVVDVELVTLERNPNDKAMLDNIFRLVHTIKGTCGFLGLPRLEAIAHAAENVLGKFRDGELSVTSDYVTLILRSLDRIKLILAGLEEAGCEPDGTDLDLIEELDAVDARDEQPILDKAVDATIQAGENTVDYEALEAAFAAAPGPDTDPKDLSLIEKLGGDAVIKASAKTIGLAVANEAGLKAHFGGRSNQSRRDGLEAFLLAALREDIDRATIAARAACDGDSLGKGEIDAIQSLFRACVIDSAVDQSAVQEAGALISIASSLLLEPFKKQESTATPENGPHNSVSRAPRNNQSVRVNVDLLEHLMTLVSELVLTRNQLLQMVRHQDESEFSVPLQRLSQCTTELQEGVMKTRMQPIGNAWAQLPRIVRDLSSELGKEIRLEMKGENTELDRQVLELIKDPLTHMVRNSADHGIESLSERQMAGKDDEGVISLNAYHEGGHIVIEITDDGFGINADKLRAKIQANDLVSETKLSEMSDAQVHKYIFHPGLSTAEQVTSVSGRGVGMDVVRTNIEKIGGTIDLVSEKGRGTKFLIKIPLTLAIVSALIVEAGGEKFAMPQISVLELVRSNVEGGQRIECIDNTPVFRLRDRLLPLVYLEDVLGFDADNEKKNAEFVIVTQVGAFTFGIVVDQVFDTEEIVVKPVSPILKNLSIYAGNTILGDGSVIMILDPNGLSNAVSDVAPEQQSESFAKKRSKDGELENMLLFKAEDDTPKAVPLSLIARLEEIPVENIEYSDGQAVVQYRGVLMPLVTMSSHSKFCKEGVQPILVFSDEVGRNIGLAVDQVLDIVESQLDIELNTNKAGLIGTSVIAGRVTEIIDIAHYIKLAFADWATEVHSDREKRKPMRRLLLIDDSAFFRNLLKPLLLAAGYHVEAVPTADAALQLRRDGEDFDLIISDIDMPGKNGLEFAEDVKQGGKWADVPMIALSGLHSSSDCEKGLKAGFNHYVAKMDRDALLEALEQELHHNTRAA